MKRLFTKLMLVAVAAMAFVACQNDSDEINKFESKSVVSFSAGFADTRSEFTSPTTEGGVTKFGSVWSGNETIAISLNEAELVGAAVEAAGATTTFKAELTDDGTTEGTIYLFSPKGIYDKDNPENNKAGFTGMNTQYHDAYVVIPDVQTPSATSVDPLVHLLAAECEYSDALPSAVEVDFRHVAAYAKMTITGFAKAIDKVEVTASEPLAGTSCWYYYAGEKDGQLLNANKRTITVNNFAADNNIFWFGCAPADLSEGTLSVKVYSGEDTYTKELPIEGHNFCFKQGRVASFSVNMTDVEKDVIEVVTIEDGQYVIAAYVNGVYYALPNKSKSSAGTVAGGEITLTNGVVSANDAADYVWTITAVEGGYTLYNGSEYLTGQSSGTGLKTQADAVVWGFENGEYGYKFISPTNNDRCLLYQAGTTNKFGNYASNNYGATNYFSVCLLPVEESEVVVGEGYKLVTSLDDVTSGEYVIAAYVGDKYYAMSNTIASKIDGTEIAVADDTIANDAANGFVYTIARSGNNITIKSGDDFLKYSSSTNLGSQTNTYGWTISEGTKGSFRLTSSTSSRGVIYRAGTTNKFGGYAFSNVTAEGTEYFDVELFKNTADVGGSDEPIQVPLATPDVDATVNTEDVEWSIEVTWVAIKDAEYYIVSCTDGEDYKESVQVDDTRCEFGGLDYSTEYTITVVAHPAEGDELYLASEAGKATVTTGADPSTIPVIEDGQYVVAGLVDGVYYALPNANKTSAGTIAHSVIGVTDGKVSANDAIGYVWTIKAVEGGYTFFNGEQYLTAAETNGAKLKTEAEAAAAVWALDASVDYGYKFISPKAVDRYLSCRIKENYNLFGAYKAYGDSEYYGVHLLPIDGEVKAQKLTMSTLTATTTSNSIAVSWTAVTGAQNYAVSLDDGAATTVTETSHTFTGLSASTTYTISVVAKGDGVNYTDSDAVNKQVTTEATQQGGEAVTITLDCTKQPFTTDLPTSKGTYNEATYTDNAGYQWTLCGTSATGYYFNSDGYLMIGKSGSYIGLPIVEGKKLTSVTLYCNSVASTSVKYEICDTLNNEVSGGSDKNGVNDKTTALTWNLSDTTESTQYRIRITTAYNGQITKIVLNYN